MLELGKDDVQGMETDEGDVTKQQKYLVEGKSGDVKMKKEENPQVWQAYDQFQTTVYAELNYVRRILKLYVLQVLSSPFSCFFIRYKALRLFL